MYLLGLGLTIAAFFTEEYKWQLISFSLIPGFLDGFYHTCLKEKPKEKKCAHCDSKNGLQEIGLYMNDAETFICFDCLVESRKLSLDEQKKFFMNLLKRK